LKKSSEKPPAPSSPAAAESSVTLESRLLTIRPNNHRKSV
jgi:hypothetical protein